MELEPQCRMAVIDGANCHLGRYVLSNSTATTLVLKNSVWTVYYKNSMGLNQQHILTYGSRTHTFQRTC